jgi:hypothetical protein
MVGLVRRTEGGVKMIPMERKMFYSTIQNWGQRNELNLKPSWRKRLNER